MAKDNPDTPANVADLKVQIIDDATLLYPVLITYNIHPRSFTESDMSLLDPELRVDTISHNNLTQARVIFDTPKSSEEVVFLKGDWASSTEGALGKLREITEKLVEQDVKEALGETPDLPSLENLAAEALGVTLLEIEAMLEKPEMGTQSSR